MDRIRSDQLGVNDHEVKINIDVITWDSYDEPSHNIHVGRDNINMYMYGS